MAEDLFGKKLAQYARKQPKHFLQIDGFNYAEEFDEDVPLDAEGDSIRAQSTVELMQGATVRVFIPYEADPVIAARLMKKIAKWLKKQPELLEFGKPEPEKNPLHDDDIPF